MTRLGLLSLVVCAWAPLATASIRGVFHQNNEERRLGKGKGSGYDYGEVPYDDDFKAPCELCGAANSGGTPECFSGDVSVYVENKGVIPMSELQVGDHVLASGSDIHQHKADFQRVVAFAHYHPHRHAEFLKLYTSQESPPLELTRDHLVYLYGNAHPVRADAIRVGDALLSRRHEGVAQRVTYIGRVRKLGVYAPLTQDGTLVVNGMQASSYISLQTNSNNNHHHGEYMSLGSGSATKIPLPLSHHDFCHMAVAPYRLYCTYFAHDQCANVLGLPPYVGLSLGLVEWLQQQHVLVETLGMAIIVGLTGTVYAVEQMLNPGNVVSHGWNYILILAAVAMCAYHMRRRTTKAHAKVKQM